MGGWVPSKSLKEFIYARGLLLGGVFHGEGMDVVSHFVAMRKDKDILELSDEAEISVKLVA